MVQGRPSWASMPPSCQRRLASRRAAAPCACAAGTRAGAWATCVMPSEAISRARWCPLMVSLSHAAYASVVPAEAGTSQLCLIGASLVGAHAPVMPAKAGIQDGRCRWHAQPAVGRVSSRADRERHGVLVPAHGEMSNHAAYGRPARHDLALFDVGVPRTSAKAGIQTEPRVRSWASDMPIEAEVSIWAW